METSRISVRRERDDEVQGKLSKKVLRFTGTRHTGQSRVSMEDKAEEERW